MADDARNDVGISFRPREGLRRPPSNITTHSHRRGSITSSASPSDLPTTPARLHPPWTVGGHDDQRGLPSHSLESTGEDHRDRGNASATSQGDSKRPRSDSEYHVCICQPDPKIPRPRNAFILYRQHHQAAVIAQYPGLPNPEISKIIGEQWQAQPAKVKDKWRRLAEEEKLRHQRQYPGYRYQPKRGSRRPSLSADPTALTRAECPKCGGRSLLPRSAPHTTSHFSLPSPPAATPGATTAPAQSNTPPQSARTPLPRTLPALQELRLQPTTTPLTEPRTGMNNMSTPRAFAGDVRDDMTLFGPEVKRRRFERDRPGPLQPAALTRSLNTPSEPSATTNPPSLAFGPGVTHPFTPLARRESLPGLRGMVSLATTSLAPPARLNTEQSQPITSREYSPAYSSLTLPPLRTALLSSRPPPTSVPIGMRIADDAIAVLPFRYKVKILRQVAPPAPIDSDAVRGPLIAIEGDDMASLSQLGRWLYDELRKSEGFSVNLLEGPDVSTYASAHSPMTQYHLLIIDWLTQSEGIIASIQKSSVLERRTYERHDVDEKRIDLVSSPPPPSISATTARPVTLVTGYSVHASDVFAARIPIGQHESYTANDHWQWAATQWRGVVGPDLTILIKDVSIGEMDRGAIEMIDSDHMFVVKRTSTSSSTNPEGFNIEPSTLRRLGFELGEWIRGFEKRE